MTIDSFTCYLSVDGFCWIHLAELTAILGSIGGFCMGVVVTRMLSIQNRKNQFKKRNTTDKNSTYKN
ncbi:hypothetical protein NMT12_190035 [metagenome]